MKSTEKLPVEANYRLKEVREALEMTREDMASLLAFSYQVYSAIERGERSLFVDRLEALKKTRASVDYIITGGGEKINETKSELFETRYSLLSEKQKKFVMLIIDQLLGWDE